MGGGARGRGRGRGAGRPRRWELSEGRVSLLFVFTTVAIPDPVSRAIALAERFRVLAKQRREVDLESANTLAELDELQRGTW